MPATAPQITARHLANRHQVVQDMATFLLQHHAAVGSFVDVVEAALAFACGLNDDQWSAVGVLTDHYANGGEPDADTTAAVLTHLERMLPKRSAVDGTEFVGLPR